jgi:hypothetical protein
LQLPEKHFHRFGGGKPLGFGSVRLDLEPAKSQILTGSELRQRYESLELDVHFSASITADLCKAGFESAVTEVGHLGLLEAFKQSARGFTDAPIHYPRARHNQNLGESVPPHPEGLAYEWFVENAKPLNRDLQRRDNPETQFVLSDLLDDKGLPILYHKP